MGRIKTPESIEEIIQKNNAIDERYKKDRLHLSLTAAEFIVEEHGGITRNIGLYAIAMYALHGPTNKQVKWFKGITDKLNTSQGGDVIASADKNGAIIGAYKLQSADISEDRLWNFEVRFCYVNPDNNMNAYVGDLLLGDAIESSSGYSPRTLSKKWLNHGYEGNNDEPYCHDVVIGLPAILDGGISGDDAKRLNGLIG